MHAPVIRKIVDSENVLIERALPEKGSIQVEIGEEVRPFDHLGHCSVSQKQLRLPPSFKPSVSDPSSTRTFVYMGAVLGKAGSTKITAPYNGYLVREDKMVYRFEEEPHKYILLSGVWGKVEKIIPEVSVLLKTITKDIQLIASTRNAFVGELVVFPSQKDFFEKYFISAVSSKPSGKIIYVGDYVDTEMIKKAKETSAGAIIAGSARRDVLSYAKRNGMHFGLISGFSESKTLSSVYDLLNKVGERLIFFNGDKGLLRIPLSPDEESVLAPKKPSKSATAVSKTKPIQLVRKNMTVLTFQGAYFSYIGTVDSVKESSILVKFPNVEDRVEIYIPNFFILE